MRPLAWPMNPAFGTPQELPKSTSRISLVLLAGHVPLAAIMYGIRPAATAHAFGVFLLGLLFLARRRNDLALYMVGYMAGAEVLWRICEAQTNHEFAKLAGTVLLAGIGFRHFNFKRSAWIVFYMLLLLPSAYLTLDDLPLEFARKRLSFNLSGPISLTIAVLTFSNLKITAAQLRRFLLSFTYPIIGICTCIAISLITSDQLDFNTQSNFEASAGFGPNQVSSILAMGAICMFLFHMVFLNKRLFRSPFVQRQLTLWLMALFLIQSAFTFSRGGIYMATASILASGVILLRDREARKKFIFSTVALGLLGIFVVLPVLNRYTEGAFLDRYLETDTTGRADILDTELLLWQKNWLLGVGPGMRIYHIDEDNNASAAHTEYTRMIGEHGLLGVLALFILLFGIFAGWRSLDNYQSKAIGTATTVCAMLFWAVNGMRIFAPQVLIGLLFVTILWKPEAPKSDFWMAIDQEPPPEPDDIHPAER